MDQYNWNRLEFPVVISRVNKFEKNNKDIAVDVLYICKKEKQGSKSIACYRQRKKVLHICQECFKVLIISKC